MLIQDNDELIPSKVITVSTLQMEGNNCYEMVSFKYFGYFIAYIGYLADLHGCVSQNLEIL